MERIVRSATQGPSQRTQPRERRRSRVNRKSRESRQPPVLPEQGQNDQNYQTLYSSACPCSEKDTEERFDSRGGERSRLIQRFRDASVTWTWRRLDALSLPPQCPTPKLATHSTLAWCEKCPHFWWADISFIRSVCIRLDTSATWREWTRGRVRKKDAFLSAGSRRPCTHEALEQSFEGDFAYARTKKLLLMLRERGEPAVRMLQSLWPWWTLKG